MFMWMLVHFVQTHQHTANILHRLFFFHSRIQIVCFIFLCKSRQTKYCMSCISQTPEEKWPFTGFFSDESCDLCNARFTYVRGGSRLCAAGMFCINSPKKRSFVCECWYILFKSVTRYQHVKVKPVKSEIRLHPQHKTS